MSRSCLHFGPSGLQPRLMAEHLQLSPEVTSFPLTDADKSMQAYKYLFLDGSNLGGARSPQQLASTLHRYHVFKDSLL